MDEDTRTLSTQIDDIADFDPLRVLHLLLGVNTISWIRGVGKVRHIVGIEIEKGKDIKSVRLKSAKILVSY